MAEVPRSPVREGDLLVGKYRVERVIGSGGMGVVVAARHEQLGQLVAIKFMREEALQQGDAVERFLREARAAVKLKSEHVAKVLDVGKLDSGAPYMVMEMLEGSDLGRVLMDDGPMAVDAAVLMILQACEAIAEAHSLGIVHRDLKPQNLFLTQTMSGLPRLKVLDFGVSKAIGMASGERGALTQTRAMLGSPLYMPPEQMRSSRDIDPRVDIWALGVVLFELLTRRWPFEAESMPELCLKVVTEPPQSLAALRPDVPEALVAIVERCLAKEPDGRFATALDLAAALEPLAPPLLSRMPAAQSRTFSDVALSRNPAAAQRTLPRAEVASPASSGPTPASWAGAASPAKTDRTTMPAPRPGARLVAAAVAAFLVAGVATATWLVHRSGTASNAAAEAHVAANLATSPPPSSAPNAPPSVALPAVALEPALAASLASAVTAPPAVTTTASALSTGVAPPSPTSAAPSPARPALDSAAAARPVPHPIASASASAHGPGTPRPPVRDDDIPSLR